MENKIQINKLELIKILSIYADNSPLGFELLERFIKTTAIDYSIIQIKDLIKKQNAIRP